MDRRETELSIGTFTFFLPKHQWHRGLIPQLILQPTPDSDKKNHRKIRMLSAQIKRKTLRLGNDNTSSFNFRNSRKNSQPILRLPKDQFFKSRGKTDFRKPNNPKLDKIERRV